MWPHWNFVSFARSKLWAFYIADISLLMLIWAIFWNWQTSWNCTTKQKLFCSKKSVLTNAAQNRISLLTDASLQRVIRYEYRYDCRSFWALSLSKSLCFCSFSTSLIDIPCEVCLMAIIHDCAKKKQSYKDQAYRKQGYWPQTAFCVKTLHILVGLCNLRGCFDGPRVEQFRTRGLPKQPWRQWRASEMRAA